MSSGSWIHDAPSSTSDLETKDELWHWSAPSKGGCTGRKLGSSDARKLLRDQHVVVVGDLSARLWYAALLYLVNGTAQPSEVADGYPLHKERAGASCAWNPDSMRRGGYDFGGWAHFKKGSPCFLRWYGHKFGTLLDKPLTLNHAKGSKAWVSTACRPRPCEPRAHPACLHLCPAQQVDRRVLRIARTAVGAWHHPRRHDHAATRQSPLGHLA